MPLSLLNQLNITKKMCPLIFIFCPLSPLTVQAARGQGGVEASWCVPTVGGGGEGSRPSKGRAGEASWCALTKGGEHSS